jgi:hypothetical protein
MMTLALNIESESNSIYSNAISNVIVRMQRQWLATLTPANHFQLSTATSISNYICNIISTQGTQRICKSTKNSNICMHI